MLSVLLTLQGPDQKFSLRQIEAVCGGTRGTIYNIEQLAIKKLKRAAKERGVEL